MFGKIQQRFRDMRSIKSLCEQAEQHARSNGQEPGAEHFVLAALDMPDGTAQAAFARLGVDGHSYKEAIRQQAANALHSVGVQVDVSVLKTSNPQRDMPTTGGLYQAQASGQNLMQALASQQKPPGLALMGAHVLLAACTAQYGVAVRALRAMGIEPAKLAEAARAEIHAWELARA